MEITKLFELMISMEHSYNIRIETLNMRQQLKYLILSNFIRENSHNNRTYFVNDSSVSKHCNNSDDWFHCVSSVEICLK